jgi:DNA replication initiation complex subunit (GINS family)
LFDSLRRVQLQERQSSGLASVSEGFFDECRAFLKQMRERGENGDSTAMREAGNFEEVFKNVVSARAQKILFKAFRDLKAGTVTTEGLAREEKEFYNSLTKLFTEFEASVLHFAFPPASEQATAESGSGDSARKSEKPVAASVLKNVKARFLLDLPRFPWQDSTQYGPFKKGEVAELRKELADFLNERKAIEFVSN